MLFTRTGNLKMSHIKGWITLFALVFATGAWATDDATFEKKKCDSEIYAAIERDLRLAGFAKRAQDENERFIVSQACKTWPYKPEFTLVALAYPTGGDNDADVQERINLGEGIQWAILIAIFDKKTQRIIHSDQRQIQEDAETAIGDRSLGFDTARYQLADNVRAFGLRFTSAASGASCTEFSKSDWLTLLIPEGRSLRPVLGLYRQTAEAIAGCLNSPAPLGDSVRHYANLAIGVEKALTNGFYDLRVTATIDEDNGERAKQEHVIFRYNEKHYAPVGEIPWWLAFDPSSTLPLSVSADEGQAVRWKELEKNGYRVVSGPLSVAAIEQEELAEMKEHPHAPQAPFGHINDEWENLKAGMRPGDEIFRVDYFYHGNYSEPQGGWRGLVWVRDGVIVESLVEIIYE
jgi:hypothetical protein